MCRHPGFLTDLDLYAEEELKTDPFYRDMLYPRGLGWGAEPLFTCRPGTAQISLEPREYARGQVEPAAVLALDELRPHRRERADVARLQLQRARTASQTLNAIGLAALVLDEKGKVLAAKSLIEAMTDHVQWRAHDQFSLNDKSGDQLLRAAMEAIENLAGAVCDRFRCATIA